MQCFFSPHPVKCDSYEGESKVCESKRAVSPFWPHLVLSTPPVGLTIQSAATLGPKLESVLLYHVLPAAYTAQQLVALKSANTVLGVDLKAQYVLTFAAGAGNAVRPSLRRGCTQRG
jgi:hypothetical protein